MHLDSGVPKIIENEVGMANFKSAQISLFSASVIMTYKTSLLHSEGSTGFLSKLPKLM